MSEKSNAIRRKIQRGEKKTRKTSRKTETSNAVGMNLRRIRKAKGKTQERLAEEAQLSRAAYRKIETGESTPRIDTIQRLAKTLEVSVWELLEEAPSLERVRFRSKKRIKLRDDILINVGRWLRNYNDLLDADNAPEYKLKSLPEDLKAIRLPGNARPIQAAKMARKALGLSSTDVLADPGGMLEKAGVKLLAISVASEEFFGLSIAEDGGGPAIVVNVWERLPVERWIFSAYHELGHLLLHLDSYTTATPTDDENRDEEQEANLFASHFLMTEEAFREYLEHCRGLDRVSAIMKLKRVFLVSYKTIIVRLMEDELVEKDFWRAFNNEYRLRRGKRLSFKEEPEPLGPGYFMVRDMVAGSEPSGLCADDFVPQRLRLLALDALLDGKITMSRLAEILGTDVEEARRLVRNWRNIDERRTSRPG